MKTKLNIPLLMLLATLVASNWQMALAQNSPDPKASNMATLTGHISCPACDNQVIPYATVAIKEIMMSTSADENGLYFLKNVPPGKYTVTVQSVGYKTYTQRIVAIAGETIHSDYALEEDLFNMDQVVVTGNRRQQARSESPVVVHSLGRATLEQTSALSLAEGMGFTPGVRVENNCNNCEAKAVRINGLEGAYSQILINSRPIFSSLASVYGLDFYPPSMIDRVEVVRGGGSALYGGNAIAGTVNIITRDPAESGYGITSQLGLLNGNVPDMAISAHATAVSPSKNTGVVVFGSRRQRDHFDANNDGFSELSEMRIQTMGANAFWRPSKLHRLSLNLYATEDFRRGGNDFSLMPHQADIAEQAAHQIFNADFKYDFYTPNLRSNIQIYGAVQHLNRETFYGAGGQQSVVDQSLNGDTAVLNPDAMTALGSYGNSSDIALNTGVQYGYEIPKFMAGKAHLTLGGEVVANHMNDQMPGYGRSLDQNVNNAGFFGQVEITPLPRMRLLAGLRYDHVEINGQYDLGDLATTTALTMDVLSPRANLTYEASSNLRLRAGYARGFRAPQAFDEDLHIEIVGGASRFIVMSPKLRPEFSNNFTASAEYTEKIFGMESALSFDVFHTVISDVFINEVLTEEGEGGIGLLEKRNGAGAYVSGASIEWKLAPSAKFNVSLGYTLQQNSYSEEEVLWEPESDAGPQAVTTTNMLRTPNQYGFVMTTWEPIKYWTLLGNLSFTGAMDVPHMINPDTEYTVIKRTQNFADVMLKLQRSIEFNNGTELTLGVGVQNLFNSYQNDFDSGIDRDATYLYGPLRPRTFFSNVAINF